MSSQKFLKKSLATAVAAVCLPVMSLGFVSQSVQAEGVSADLTIASMYLWRGQNVSGTNPAISSNVQYDHSSGAYVGSWLSSEGASGSYEVDFFGGYNGSAGDISYGAGIFGYYYPEVAGSPKSSDIYEVIVSAGYKDYSVTAKINAEPDDFDDYKYFSLDGPAGPLALHLGTTITGTDANNYSDVAVSYNFTDSLSWTVSYAFGDGIVEDSAADDPLFVVSYSVPLK